MECIDHNRRILVVDDTESIHTDIRRILCANTDGDSLGDLATFILGKSSKPASGLAKYEIASAFQGRDGFEMVQQARAEQRPYALAIVDVRMPPGWDGIETIEHMRRVDPELQVAICTAYSDYSWQSIHDKFGMNDWLLIFKKPFDVVEVRQLACTMTEKWNLGHQASLRTDHLKLLLEEHAGRLRSANAELEERNRGLAQINHRLSQEINARQLADERIRHIAFHDALTDLPNRALLMDRINCCIQRAKRHSDYLFAVLYTDVDNFKIVNDSLGHRVGDEFLVHIGRELANSLRTVGDPLRPATDTVARLGGDEFVILLDDVKNVDQVRRIAERVVRQVCRPLTIDGKDILPSLSIGIAVGENDYDDAVEILRDADTALYDAKEHGKGRAALFDRDMRNKVMARLDLENDLRRAVEERQFVIYYQPIVSLITGRVESVEALVRWQHPVRGLVFPDAFIPLAEDTGLINPIGELVIDEAIRQLAEWRTSSQEAENLSVSINLSPRQLTSPQLVKYIDRRLAEFALEPAALKLEITETAMMRDLPLARAILDQFGSRQIEVYLDDFGTGYSSLSILHTLPFSALKLDRSFVRNLAEQECQTTVQAVVMLAKNRNIRLIAEGIEDYEQLVQLKRLDCEFGQGYYFTAPVSNERITALLARGAQYSVSEVDTNSSDASDVPIHVDLRDVSSAELIVT